MSVRKLLVHLRTVCVFTSFPIIGLANVRRPVVSIALEADNDVNSLRITDYAMSLDSRYAPYNVAIATSRDHALNRALITTGSTQRNRLPDAVECFYC